MEPLLEDTNRKGLVGFLSGKLLTANNKPNKRLRTAVLPEPSPGRTAIKCEGSSLPAARVWGWGVGGKSQLAIVSSPRL